MHYLSVVNVGLSYVSCSLLLSCIDLIGVKTLFYSFFCLIYKKYVTFLHTVGPLLFESSWAKNLVCTGALEALDDLSVVQMKL